MTSEFRLKQTLLSSRRVRAICRSFAAAVIRPQILRSRFPAERKSAEQHASSIATISYIMPSSYCSLVCSLCRCSLACAETAGRTALDVLSPSAGCARHNTSSNFRTMLPLRERPFHHIYYFSPQRRPPPYITRQRCPFSPTNPLTSYLQSTADTAHTFTIPSSP